MKEIYFKLAYNTVFILLLESRNGKSWSSPALEERGLFPGGFHALCEEGQLCPADLWTTALLPNHCRARCALLVSGFRVGGLAGPK